MWSLERTSASRTRSKCCTDMCWIGICAWCGPRLHCKHYVMSFGMFGLMSNSKIRFGLGFLMATFFFVFGSLFGRKKSPFSTPLAVPNQGVYYPCQITCFWMYCGVYYFIVNECIWHKWLKVGFVGAMLGLCLSYVGARTVCPIRFHEVSGNDFRDHRWPNHSPKWGLNITFFCSH